MVTRALRIWFAASLCLGAAGGHCARAQVATAVAEGLHGNPPRIHALTNARLVIAPGKIVERGCLASRDGLISEAGGDPLQITTRVEAAYIDGRPVDLSNRQTSLYDNTNASTPLERTTGRTGQGHGRSPIENIRGDATAQPTANQPASMSNQVSDSISTLNKLIETCKDGQEGFRTAAEAITDDEDLKGFLFSCSLQRSKFAGELQNEVISLGEPAPSDSGTAASTIHRGWLNLRNAMTGSDNHAILAECERGEDSAVSEYRKAINANLSDTHKDIVQRQFQEVLATHNSVRGLRDELAARKPASRGAGQLASDFGASFKEKSGALGSSAAETWTGAMQSTEVYVRENPFPAILTALGIGFGLGLLVRLFERPSRETVEVPIPKAVQKVRDYDYQAAVLPFLWPVAKFFMSNYASARKGVAKAYDQASDVDVSKYTDSIVKRAKKMF